LNIDHKGISQRVNMYRIHLNFSWTTQRYGCTILASAVVLSKIYKTTLEYTNIVKYARNM